MNKVILSVIEKAEKDNQFNYFGLRVNHEVVKVGDGLGVSYNTIDDQAPEELNGICCMGISYDGFEVDDFENDLNKLIATYGDENIILVGGVFAEYGNDEIEVVIENGVVLWVKEKS
tara:strand:- start:232 stop:582 length:351 start_codon:yes stop_codon:yes gene_type:complete